MYIGSGYDIMYLGNKQHINNSSWRANVMTREKKEIIKKINEIQFQMQCEKSMGCGFTPSSYFEMIEQQYLDPLYEKLSILQKYNSVEAMLHDER